MNVYSTPYAPPPANVHRPATPVSNRLKVKSASGQLLSLIGFNFGPAQYIQIHEGTTNVDDTSGPAEARVPQFVFWVDAMQPFSLDVAATFKFTGSLWFCNSSTRDTLTAGAADCSWQAGEI